MANSTPRIDYLSRDYAALRQSLLTYAQDVIPEWQPASEGDLGLALVELFAYQGDILSYYTDRAQMEMYIQTATQRASVLSIAQLLGYLPTPGVPATGTVTLTTSSPSIVVPALTQIKTGRIDALDGPITFETDADTTLLKDTPLAVPVTEGTTSLYKKIGESTGAPAQSLLLPNTGVYVDTIRLYIEDVAGSTTFYQGTRQVTAREWLRVDHLLDADEDSPVFEAQLNADNTVTILLGDDINGAIPPTGLQIFASYRYGFGFAGNVASGQVYLINDRGIRSVFVARDDLTLEYLSSAMLGGADPEDTESIRYNAPRAYRTQQRAINEQDFLDLALGIQGVSKANVVIGSFTSITVYICGPNGDVPTQALKDLVATQFNDRTLIGVSVVVAEPSFIPVNFGTVADPMVLDLYDQYSQGAVLAAVEKAIRTYIANMPFGQKMTVGNVYEVIGNVDGVRFVDIPVMARDDSAQVGTASITPRVWEVFSAGTFNTQVNGGVA